MFLETVVTKLKNFQRINDNYRALPESQRHLEKENYETTLKSLDEAIESYLVDKLDVISKKKSKK